MNDVVTYSLHNNIATITMDDGKANVISPAMVVALNAALDQAEKDQAIVVLTGRPGVFSGGFDLSVLAESVDAAVNLVTQGSTLARRLLSFPTPVIAAVSGHAIAMGAFLLVAADYRIGIQGQFKTGLNEVLIGMTMHHAGIELARARLNTSYFNRAVINAEIFSPDKAEAAGFLDEIATGDQFRLAVDRAAENLSLVNLDAHYKTKLKARETLLNKIDWAIVKDADLLKTEMIKG